MDTRSIVRTATLVFAAMLLATFAFAAGPAGVKALAPAPAVAQEAAAPAEAAPAEAEVTAEDEAKAAEGAEVKAEAEGEGEAEGKGKEKEIPHTVGKPTASQLQDLRNAWKGLPGFNLLWLAIIGLVVSAGIIAVGALKQAKV